MYNFKSGDAAEADLLAAKLSQTGRDPVAKGDAFYGHPDPINRIRELYPDVWAWSPQEARECSEAYVMLGWSGILPESCKGRTMIIPVNYQWAFWGWPNRLIARMEEHGGKVLVIGPAGEDKPRGLTLPEQLGEIPDSFNGYVWVEDGFNIIPALIQRFDDRTQDEIDAGFAALAARRAAQ
jgi:glycerophosphoryl diester phosphodiesterase